MSPVDATCEKKASRGTKTEPSQPVPPAAAPGTAAAAAAADAALDGARRLDACGPKRHSGCARHLGGILRPHRIDLWRPMAGARCFRGFDESRKQEKREAACRCR